jgi:NAD(P)-dependent dehydrogenase (short-subunit alcohol dehydrogenase family)
VTFAFDPAVAAGERPTLDGKVALVTGAANGIGAAAVALFSRAGATVVGCDLERAPGAVRADVTSTDEMDALAADVVAQHGRIDILYNNAGVGTIRDEPVPLHLTEDWVWEQTVGVNLRGTFVASRAVLPHMIAAGAGSIVNVSSVYGLAAGPAAPSYCAAKSGVIGLTRAMAVDYACHGIRVNAICPGFTETAMVLDYVAKLEDPTRARAEIDGAHLAGRLARPDEIAAAALWLASNAASFVTGAVLPVDGGYTTR